MKKLPNLACSHCHAWYVGQREDRTRICESCAYQHALNNTKPTQKNPHTTPKPQKSRKKHKNNHKTTQKKLSKNLKNRKTNILNDTPSHTPTPDRRKTKK